MSIKPAWIITDMQLQPFMKDGLVVEYKSERAARKACAEVLSSCPSDSEAWVWRLSLVASRPDLLPTIDEVK